MTNRSRIGAIVGIVLFLGFAFFLTRSDPHVLSLEVHPIEEQNESFDIHVEYPQFSGFPKSFNRKIADLVNQKISHFKKTGEENRLVRVKSGDTTQMYPYLLSIGWIPSELNSQEVSFLMRTSYYTGGAHGGEELDTFTYNTEEKKEITLEDLFGETPNYLNRISQFALDDLKDQLKRQAGGVEPNMDMLNQGTAPLMKNFEKFTLGPGNVITFYFPQYQVAAYAYGEQKVVMPLSYILSDDSVR